MFHTPHHMEENKTPTSPDRPFHHSAGVHGNYVYSFTQNFKLWPFMPIGALCNSSNHFSCGGSVTHESTGD